MTLRSLRGFRRELDVRDGLVSAAVAAGLAVSVPLAFADDVDGGHCTYGDFSVNVAPSCDTDNAEYSSEGARLIEISWTPPGQLSPT